MLTEIHAPNKYYNYNQEDSTISFKDKDPDKSDKTSLMSQFKVLDVEKTNVVSFLLIHLCVFVVPLFASILLLVDNIEPLYAVFTDEQISKIKMAIGKSLILLSVCVISFLEMLAIVSHIFVVFVATELLLWIAFLFGMSYTEELSQNSTHHNAPIIAISVCIIFKVCVGVFMRRQLHVFIKSKTFLRRMGKSV